MKKYSDSIGSRFSGRHKKGIKFVGDVEGKTILNIGCAFGWFEDHCIKNSCKEIIAIEPNNKLINIAMQSVKSHNAKFLNFSIHDFLHLKNGSLNYKFDMITMFDVIEHIPRNSELYVLSRLNLLLNDNGVIYLSTPYNSIISNLFDPAWYFGHRHYSLSKLQHLSKEAGYTIESISYGGGWYDIIYMILLYFFKWIFRVEVPYQSWFDRKRDLEYLNKEGMFNIIFIKLKKSGDLKGDTK